MGQTRMTERAAWSFTRDRLSGRILHSTGCVAYQQQMAYKSRWATSCHRQKRPTPTRVMVPRFSAIVYQKRCLTRPRFPFIGCRQSCSFQEGSVFWLRFRPICGCCRFETCLEFFQQKLLSLSYLFYITLIIGNRNIIYYTVCR